jgi:hypothetical protein
LSTLEKANAKERKDWLRRFNRKVTNPIMLTFAGRRHYTVVDHIGRHSKRLYQTPVLGQPTEAGFFIPLPYGEDTDWCRNVLAAGGCTVHWNGRAYRLTSPHIVEQASGEAVFSPLNRFLLHIAGVHKYLETKQ